MEEKIILIKDHPDFIKDEKTGAILNTNVQALETYRNNKRRKHEEKSRINKLEQDILELKSLVAHLLEKK